MGYGRSKRDRLKDLHHAVAVPTAHSAIRSLTCVARGELGPDEACGTKEARKIVVPLSNDAPILRFHLHICSMFYGLSVFL